MGIFDWLSGSREEAQEAAPSVGRKAFKLAYTFNPLRLNAYKDSKVKMEICVENTSGKKQLASVDVEIPSGYKVGFDVSSAKRRHEERIGELEAGASKTFSLYLYGNPATKQAEVPLRMIAYSHYLNYNKVLEQAERSAKLRVI